MSADITLAALDEGAGEPAFLLIHGLCSGKEDWQPQVEMLAHTNRVIAVDLRGHGETPRGTASISMEQLAADCLEHVRAKGLKQLVVAGHSMGTRVAFEIANQAPDMVNGLLLVDGSNGAAGRAQQAHDEFENILQQKSWREFAQGLFEQMFFDDAHKALEAQLVERALSVPEETGIALYRSMLVWDGEKAEVSMREARVPILVIQSTTRSPGGTSRKPLDRGERGPYPELVARNAPQAEISLFPGRGHFVTREAPAEVNAAIDSWARSLGFIR